MIKLAGIMMFLVLFIGFLPFLNGESGGTESVSASLEKEKTSVEKMWGVEVVFLRLSAAGRMVDFRYKVLDPEKSLVIFDGKVKPVVIDQATGTRMSVVSMPKAGAFRQKTLKPEIGRTYFILFKNENGLIKAGDKADVEIGEVKLTGLTVQ